MYNNSFSQSTRSISASSAFTSTFRDSDSLTFARSAIMENMPYAALAKASANVEPLATRPVSAVCSMSSNRFLEVFTPAPRRLLLSCVSSWSLGWRCAASLPLSLDGRGKGEGEATDRQAAVLFLSYPLTLILSRQGRGECLERQFLQRGTTLARLKLFPGEGIRERNRVRAPSLWVRKQSGAGGLRRCPTSSGRFPSGPAGRSQ